MSSLIGISGIVYGLYFVFTFPRAGFSGYYDLPSLVLLGLLPPSIMLLSHQLRDFFTGITTLIRAIFGNVERQHRLVINSLTSCSAQSKSNAAWHACARARCSAGVIGADHAAGEPHAVVCGDVPHRWVLLGLAGDPPG